MAGTSWRGAGGKSIRYRGREEEDGGEEEGVGGIFGCPWDPLVDLGIPWLPLGCLGLQYYINCG